MTYELAVLYDPGLEVDLSKAEERVKKIIADNKGEIKETDNWGKRKLAYKIKGNEYAIYVFYTLDVPPENIHQVEVTLNITSEIIRFLISKPDLKAIAKAEELKAKKAEQAAKRGESDEEEDEGNEELNNA